MKVPEHLKELNVFNPDSGQTMTCTQKQFDSLYRDKGFQIVDRDNADQAAQGQKAKTNFARPSKGAGSAAGTSAKDVAANIGLDESKSNQPPDENAGPMTFSEGAADTAQRNKDTAK
jgi:hypothetical protein